MTEILTDLHRANLKKLADYLMTLPEDYANFDMASYFCEDGFADEKMLIEGSSINQCGTSACAVGHAQDAGLTLTVDMTDCTVNWRQTSIDLFGLSSSLSYGGWNWCFAAEWETTDNSPQGAAKRIYWFLDKGLPTPEDVEDMHEGELALCYE